ncbi:unnamed protein product [Owenia fusiformis]|uniref:Uncharacterized protein n=1 Tax=Owenia fusiformis TaxID=6347 RepID=A0A8J1UW19_OWEFU|nr:unnamed protein product [Owenia fusiformis]
MSTPEEYHILQAVFSASKRTIPISIQIQRNEKLSRGRTSLLQLGNCRIAAKADINNIGKLTPPMLKVKDFDKADVGDVSPNMYRIIDNKYVKSVTKTIVFTFPQFLSYLSSLVCQL